jgi:hypothetical protein
MKYVEQNTENALSHIFAEHLPLNPESVTAAAQGCDPDEVLAYMHEHYGWNETFSIDPYATTENS